jgi:hypothetical protein
LADIHISPDNIFVLLRITTMSRQRIFFILARSDERRCVCLTPPFIAFGGFHT